MAREAALCASHVDLELVASADVIAELVLAKAIMPIEVCSTPKPTNHWKSDGSTSPVGYFYGLPLISEPNCCVNSFHPCSASLVLIVLYPLPPFSPGLLSSHFLAKKKSIWNHLISNSFRPYTRYLLYSHLPLNL